MTMELVKNITIAEPIFLRNLVITPVKSDTTNGLNPATIEEILRSGIGSFQEIDIPDINEITFENRGNSPVLLLDGEEVIGALQNRIIARSHLVAAQSSENIPVVCVEEGRWDDIGGFETGYCSYPQLRSILAQSRYKKSDTQKIIWNEINRKLTVTRTRSTTSSMHDIYENLQAEVSRYVEDFESLNHFTIGFIGSAGNRILGCDLFQNSKIYQKFEDKLIRSYALDAIEYQNKPGGQPNVEKFLTNVLSMLRKKRVRKQEINVTIKGHGFLGQILIYDNRFVHLSTFPK